MTWEELLDEFRALGGVAENVRLGDGPNGRGIFVVDPSKPATLHCPVELQVPVSSVSADSVKMHAKARNLDPRAQAFFEAYQDHFGWGAGAYRELEKEQAAWHELPADLRTRLNDLAMLNVSEMRFRAPDLEVCIHNYLHARKFLRDGTAYIVPMIDLVNHSGFMPEYVYTNGIGVHGTFSDEMLVKYNSADPWSMILLYGFAAPGATAFSLAITIALPDGRNLSIARNIADFREQGGLRLPALQPTADGFMLSHLALGFVPGKDLPRAIFRKVLTPVLSAAQADLIFEGIAHYNRTQFIALLRQLRAHEGQLVRSLEDAAIDQLEALSACIGARAL